MNINGSSQNNSTSNSSQLLEIQKIEKIVLAIPEELASSTEIKNFFESDLKKKGWKIEVQLMPWNKLMEGYANKKLQSFLVSMNMDYPNAEFLLKNFESNSPDNFSGLNDAIVDQLIKEFNTKQDKREREEIYKKVLTRIEELAVNVNLFYPRTYASCGNSLESTRYYYADAAAEGYIHKEIDEDFSSQNEFLKTFYEADTFSLP